MAPYHKNFCDLLYRLCIRILITYMKVAGVWLISVVCVFPWNVCVLASGIFFFPIRRKAGTCLYLNLYWQTPRDKSQVLPATLWGSALGHWVGPSQLHHSVNTLGSEVSGFFFEGTSLFMKKFFICPSCLGRQIPLFSLWERRKAKVLISSAPGLNATPSLPQWLTELQFLYMYVGHCGGSERWRTYLATSR